MKEKHTDILVNIFLLEREKTRLRPVKEQHTDILVKIFLLEREKTRLRPVKEKHTDILVNICFIGERNEKTLSLSKHLTSWVSMYV